MIELPIQIPAPPGWGIDWDAIEASPFGALLHGLRHVGQNPAYHGEGDAWTHTRMVCEALVGDREYREASALERAELFVSALLHDVGKATRTRREGGAWVSPGHALAGAQIARQFMWQVLDIAGTEEKRLFRETVCLLVRFHSKPLHFLSSPAPERLAMSMAAEGDLVGGFMLSKLAILVRADIEGREAKDVGRLMDEIALFSSTADELGCLRSPPRFADAFSRFAWLEGRIKYPGQQLYNDTWGTVYMMCGLPGTGKDTWIRRNLAEHPVVSLDAIRESTGITWEGRQGPVVAHAIEKAREYLRARQPFVWNATCLRPDFRNRELQLFRDYGAYTKIVVLETPWLEEMKRNSERAAAVPKGVIEALLGKFTPPSIREAHEISWLTT